MAPIKFVFRGSVEIILAVLLTLIITPNILLSQKHNNQISDLPDYAIKNFAEGFQSDIYGIKMSLIYFAGKYKLNEVSKDLLEVIQNSTDDQICQMAVWSLYQMGDASLCEDLELMLSNHPSEKLRNFCTVLKMIHEYDPRLQQRWHFL